MESEGLSTNLARDVRDLVSVKAWRPGEQEKKRKKRLAEQRNARARGLDLSRSAAAVEGIDETIVDSESHASSARVLAMADSHGKDVITAESTARFSFPEHMLELPHDLRESWICAAKPKGIRCMVEAFARSKCTSTSLTGALLHSFYAKLPSGTVLDCIFSKQTQTYVVLDCLSWRGQQYKEGTDFEFRQFFLASKLLEGVQSDFAFQSLEFFTCDSEGIAQAHERSQFDINSNGLLFFHKEADYDVGLTPLVLQWEDYSGSDVHIGGIQRVSLTPRHNADGEGTTLCTLDGVPLLTTFEYVPLCIERGMNTLVQCEGGVGLSPQGLPVLHDATITSIVETREDVADTWSKVYSDACASRQQALLPIAFFI